MASKKYGWFPAAPKHTKPTQPDSVKRALKERADELIENVIKPQHVKLPPADHDFNYLADVYSKWYRNYFYFCAQYNCPSPDAIAPSFEVKFARMEYVGKDKFNLSYMRHTGQWWEIYQELPMSECLKLIAEEPHFVP